MFGWEYSLTLLSSGRIIIAVSCIKKWKNPEKQIKRDENLSANMEEGRIALL